MPTATTSPQAIQFQRANTVKAVTATYTIFTVGKVPLVFQAYSSFCANEGVYVFCIAFCVVYYKAGIDF